MKIIAKDLELWTLISDLKEVIESNLQYGIIENGDDRDDRELDKKIFDKLKEYIEDETIQSD